ncbi:MAG TPA: HAD family acid phosphatase, partial [Gemmatimonadaceae bacterium]|nr:HAD family acid phosphatase [Gemmatimonadaceae bacterium]
LLLASTLAVAGCAARTETTTAASSAPRPAAAAHENLNAVVWMQTALEYEASAVQAYRLAQLQVDAALGNPAWTAAIEQTGDASKLPPAVIVDVDETVLDNSYYQARMIRDRTEYSSATWDPWVTEARATAIPGALEFAKYAAGKGVVIFYVTNRTANLEDATRRNLTALGFPVARQGQGEEPMDAVLTRGERPEWQASAKGTRRAHVARTHRILLLVGDDLGDFVADATGTVPERQAKTAPQQEWWGRRWIMIPNPSYGSWERAVIGSSKDPLAAKRAVLRFEGR